ncbi:MAG: ABC transporter permease [Lentisphaeria bacterium]|nr:ABC transporter permease [Lentisphaeria bacterium]
MDTWKKFKNDPLALSGLFIIFFLVFLAVSAPLIANEKPLLLYVNGHLSSPAFSELFTPESPEIFVEKSWNFLLLFLPCSIVLFLTGKLFSSAKRKKYYQYSFVIVFLLLLLPFVLTGSRIDKTPWREMTAKLKSPDFALYAPIPYGPFEMADAPYEKSSFRHLAGTDQSGRDVLARMIYGSRVSLSVGFCATLLSLFLGTLAGLVCGYLGGKTDLFLMRFVEIVICFPTFLLLLILMTILLDYGSRQSILLVIIVLGLTSWTTLARLIRGETLKQRKMAYIQSCECMGVPVYKILFLHLLPNVSGPVFVTFTFEVAGAVLAESSLSFLGFGVQDPTASWGELLRQAYPDPLSYSHLMFYPGLAIFLTVCAFNFAGEGLRKALNGK